jgi:hypothetical protein
MPATLTLEWPTPVAFAGCFREHIGWIPSMSKEFKEEVLTVGTVGQDGKDRLLDEYMLTTMGGSSGEPKRVPKRERTRE